MKASSLLDPAYSAYLSQMVHEIEDEPFQAHYKRRPWGPSVRGWATRLEAYFWPKPEIGYAQTLERLRPLLSEGQALAEACRPWSDATAVRAVRFANAVFAWGGVRQRVVTAAPVDQVLQAALSGTANGAPMNSGWSKVAAFATAQLESQHRSQAIWDSRVSWSLVRRSDRTLSTKGHTRIPTWLRSIGKVPGRGGSRTTMRTTLPWPNAYRSWPSHFAASALIRDLRDELNHQGIAASTYPGSNEPWTVRAVEMVLFMDGY